MAEPTGIALPPTCDEQRLSLIDCWRSGQIPEARMIELLRADPRLGELVARSAPPPGATAGP